MKNKIKNYLKDNQHDIIVYSVGVVAGIVSWTIAGRVYGFQMVRPIALVDNKMIVQSVSGKILSFEGHSTPES